MRSWPHAIRVSIRSHWRCYPFEHDGIAAIKHTEIFANAGDGEGDGRVCWALVS
jgi:hypothetical protein